VDIVFEEGWSDTASSDAPNCTKYSNESQEAIQLVCAMEVFTRPNLSLQASI
jgi:hypothetical protein